MALAKDNPPQRPPGKSVGRARSRRRTWLGALASALTLWLAPSSWSVGDPASLEYKVKAGYLFNFAKFIEWPDSTPTSADNPFIIGVLDAGEALPTMMSLLQGKRINGRNVVVKAVAVDTVGKDLHILFITSKSKKNPEDLKAALAGTNTLLVGETDQFAERGGMLGFVKEDETIRLTLNLERAAEAGLKVSSKLSNVAKVVKSLRAN